MKQTEKEEKQQTYKNYGTTHPGSLSHIVNTGDAKQQGKHMIWKYLSMSSSK